MSPTINEGGLETFFTSTTGIVTMSILALILLGLVFVAVVDSSARPYSLVSIGLILITTAVFLLLFNQLLPKQPTTYPLTFVLEDPTITSAELTFSNKNDPVTTLTQPQTLNAVQLGLGDTVTVKATFTNGSTAPFSFTMTDITLRTVYITGGGVITEDNYLADIPVENEWSGSKTLYSYIPSLKVKLEVDTLSTGTNTTTGLYIGQKLGSTPSLNYRMDTVTKSTSGLTFAASTGLLTMST